jgi:hypothetical protein
VRNLKRESRHSTKLQDLPFFPAFGISIASIRNKATEEQDESSMPMENTMRSEMVFAAIAHVPNRFLLTNLAAKATRKFHPPNTRIQKTMNGVFARFRHANPIAEIKETGNVESPYQVKKAETHSRYVDRNTFAA